MKKISKTIIAVLALLFAATNLLAQEAKEPLKWSFEAKNKSDNQYDLVIHCLVAKGWHIFGSKPGGDGTITPTAVVFTKNVNVTYTGGAKENGKLTPKAVEGVKGNVYVYENRVDYVQQATISGKGKIFATITYQAGNDKTTLPKRSRDFVFEIQ